MNVLHNLTQTDIDSDDDDEHIIYFLIFCRYLFCVYDMYTYICVGVIR